MAFARRFCNDESEAEALVYRTFSEVIAGINGYTEQSAFFGWMCKILVNCHANDIRRRSNQTIVNAGTLPELEDDGATRVVEAIDAKILREAVESLPSEMKEAVLLRYFMDLPIIKVAQILAQPIGTVKSRLYYARVMLAQRLGTQIKKPAVAMIAAALFLVVSAAVIGTLIGGAGNSALPANESTWIGEGNLDAPDSKENGGLDKSILSLRSQSMAQPLCVATSSSANLSTLRSQHDVGQEDNGSARSGTNQTVLGQAAFPSAPVRVGDSRCGATLTALDTRIHAVRMEGLEALDTVIHAQMPGPNMNLNCTKRSFSIVFR